MQFYNGHKYDQLFNVNESVKYLSFIHSFRSNGQDCDIYLNHLPTWIIHMLQLKHSTVDYRFARYSIYNSSPGSVSIAALLNGVSIIVWAFE